MRPPTGLSSSVLEVWGRLISAPRGGAKLTHRTNKVPTTHSTTHGLHTTTTNAAAQSTHPTTTNSSAARSFARLLYDGAFKSIRSKYNHPQGPYSTASRLAARPQSIHSNGFATSIRGNSLRPRSSRSGFYPRPIPLHPGIGQKGLGSARKFSSAQPLFANLVNNVPLALRALGDQSRDGLDQRKWRQARREIRRAGKLQKDTHSNSRLQAAGFKSKKDEFETYFGRAASVASIPCSAIVVEEKQVAEPIVLILSVEPNVSFPVSSSSLVELEDPRSLSPSVLQTFSSISLAYAHHAVRIRALHDRLLHAGVFDDTEHVTTEAVAWRDPLDGREIREVHVSFDSKKWTRRDVRSAVGEWEEEGGWWRIVGGEKQEYDSRSETENQDDVEDHSLIMPSQAPQSVESASQESGGDQVSPTFSDHSWNDASPGVLFEYDDDGTSAAWDDDIVPADSGVYEDGVRTFLDELDSFDGSYHRF